jgi:alcohol dehydrogenase
MIDAWKFNSAGQIVFGSGAIRRLPALVRRLGAKRVAVITDPGIAKAGLLRRIEQVLQADDINPTVYAQAMPEPDMASVLACRDELATAKPDLLVALGGGSSIDLAKIIAVLLTHGGHPSDYYGENKVPGKVMPIIAIPTTAGTGSEVSPVAIVTDDKLNMKVGLSDNQLRPAVALLDPELTLRLPPYITACTGMDALTQAIEACYGKDHRFVEADGDPIYQGSNPMSDLLAERAIALIARTCPSRCTRAATSRHARTCCSATSLRAGLLQLRRVVGACGRLPVAERVPRPHGEVVGLLLPYGMQYNAVVAPDKFARIGELLGEPAQGSREARAQGGIARVFRLLETLGMPTKLSQIGITAEQIEPIVDNSLTIERLNRLNPRAPVRDDLVRLLQGAL